MEHYKVRAESPADEAAIARVTLEAFSGAEHASGTEQLIVDALRAAGELAVSLVAEAEGQIVGHVAVSPVRISTGAPSWYGLGPVSVLPQWQHRGIGTELCRQALQRLRASGAEGVVVLGDPDFYGRLGFRAEPGLVYPGVPARYFQALCWQGALPEGVVSYSAAFDASA